MKKLFAFLGVLSTSACASGPHHHGYYDPGVSFGYSQPYYYNGNYSVYPLAPTLQFTYPRYYDRVAPRFEHHHEWREHEHHREHHGHYRDRD